MAEKRQRVLTCDKCGKSEVVDDNVFPALRLWSIGFVIVEGSQMPLCWMDRSNVKYLIKSQDWCEECLKKAGFVLPQPPAKGTPVTHPNPPTLEDMIRQMIDNAVAAARQ